MCARADALDDALQDSIAVVRRASRSGSWRHALAASDVIAAMQALQAQLTHAFDEQRLAAATEVSSSSRSMRAIKATCTHTAKAVNVTLP